MRYYGIGTLTIANNEKPSTSVDLWGRAGQSAGMPKKVVIYTEAAVTGTVTVQQSDDDSNWAAYFDSNRGANVTLPSTSVLTVAPIQRYLRVNAGTNQGAERTILVFGMGN